LTGLDCQGPNCGAVFSPVFSSLSQRSITGVGVIQAPVHNMIWY
jgi:hypothetical protein